MISREICQRVLAKAVSTGADYAEIFAENTTNHSISMIASKVDSVKDTVIAGASVRLYKGMRSVMASTVDTTEAGLLRCAEAAADMSRATSERMILRRFMWLVYFFIITYSFSDCRSSSAHSNAWENSSPKRRIIGSFNALYTGTPSFLPHSTASRHTAQR